MSKNLILEVRTEDLPPSEMDRMMDQLKSLFENSFREQGIGFKEIRPFYTIRRFGILVKSLSEKQADRLIEKRGPSKKVAFGKSGTPTKALKGFLNSNGAKINEIEIRNTENGEYVFLRKKIVGIPTREFLKTELPRILSSLSFRKPMRWGNGEFKFIRPIKSVLCIFGNEVIDFEFMGIKSSNTTVGLRFFGDQIVVSSADEYIKKLKDNFVFCDQQERMEKILNQINEFENKEHFKVDRIDKLIDEINKISEYPVLVCGRFKETFLSLPEEIIETTLNHHQKALVVKDSNGNLTNLFIAFQDRPKIENNVKKGYEIVVNARLTDAEFYFQEDLKIPLEHRNEKLKGMIFQKELGTLYDKVERIKKLSIEIATMLGFKEEEMDKIKEAAILSKADIATSLVYEFPELQGIVGRIYALKQGKSEDVAYALEDQYLPGGEENRALPRNFIGAIIGLADRIDTITGNFLIGNIPTGSRDPFALRRKLYAVIRILIVFEWDLSLDDLFEISKKQIKISENNFDKEIESFVRSRLENYLVEEEQIDSDIVKAVSNRLWKKPFRAFLAARALQKHRDRKTLEDILIAFERPFNITRKHKSFDYSGILFREEIEKKLFQKYVEIKEEVEKHLDHLNYFDALEALRGLKSYIDEYFDNIFVMVNQEEIRLNRLGFLKALTEIFLNFGDLNLIERKESKNV